METHIKDLSLSLVSLVNICKCSQDILQSSWRWVKQKISVIEVQLQLVTSPEQGGVQGLLQPVAVQAALPAAPHGAHVVTELRSPGPGSLASLATTRRLAVVLDLKVLGSLWAGAGEHPGVDINLTERQVVTPETN